MGAAGRESGVVQSNCSSCSSSSSLFYIYICKKEVSFLISGQAIAGVGGIPGSLREDPRAARVSRSSVGTVLPFPWLLHLTSLSELPEMGPQLGRQKAVGKEGKNMLVEG